jgi:hypothetical protein
LIELSLDLNKSIKSFQNRITLRQGDIGEKVLISIYDNKKPVDLTEQHKVKLEGNLRNSDYVEGEANPYNSEKGKYVFQFQSKDVSIIGKYQRAFLRVYDENDNRISSEEVHIEVLKDADISQSQATTYVSKLDDLLENMDQEFESFMDEKEIDYGKLDQKCNELGSELTSIQIESTGIKKTQSDILQSIKDNKLATKTELENAKQESSANVIYQLIGKEEAEILITADFKEKITGSVVENPNIIRFLTNSTFMAPLTGSEPGQVYYDGAMTKDGVTLNVGNTNSDYMSQIQLNWNLVEIVDRTIPELFETVGLTDDSEKIEFIKKNVSYIKNTVDGVGTGLRRNRLTFKTYDSAGVLETEESVNDTAKIQELVREYADRATIKNMISDRGFLSALLFTEASDGVAVSQASLDYTKLEFKIKVSANLLIKLMIANNHVENLATQEEAESGTDNAKTMTPLRTAQQINKKAVTIAGNQTIGGIKNFKDGLMINDDLVVSKNDHSVFILDSTTSSVIAEGKLCFILHGSLVVVEGSIKFKTDVAYVAMISSSLPDSMIATINNATLVGHIGNNSAKGIFVEKGTKNIKANSVFVAGEWFTCNGVYWAGKE